MAESRNEFTDPIRTLFSWWTQALADKSKEVATNLVKETTPYLQPEADDGFLTSVAKKVWQIWIPMVADMTEALWSMPDTARDVASTVFDDDKSRGRDKLKESYNNARDRWENVFSAAISAIDENNNEDSVLGEIGFQLLNNPLLGRGIGKGASAAGKLIKWTSKVANVADDVAKAWKIWNKLKNIWKKTFEWVADLTFGKPVVDIAKTGYNAIKRWIQEKSLWSWVREVLGSAVDLWGRTLFDPWMRAGTQYTTESAKNFTVPLANKYIGGKEAAVEQSEFAKENGYTLSEVANISSPEELQYFYDVNNIPEEKRLTQEEAQKAIDNYSKDNNILSKTIRWVNDLYTSIDIFSHAATMYDNRIYWYDSASVERSEWRGEVRGVTTTPSQTTTVPQQTTTTTTPTQTTPATTTTPTQTTTTTTSQLTTKRDKTTWPAWREVDTFWKFKDLDKTELTAEINYYTVNGVLSTDTQKKFMTGQSAAYEQVIISSINEAAKQHATELIELFTPEEINKHPELQREIVKDMNAWKDLFNSMDPYFEQLLEKPQEEIDAVRMKEVMDMAYEALPEETKNTIDKNLYQRALKYNTGLEQGVDWAVMETAYWFNKFVEWAVDIVKSESRTRWYDAGLQGLSSVVINPEDEWFIDRLIDASYVAEEQAPQLIGMMITNGINNKFVEPIAEKWLNKLIQKRWALNSAIKAGLQEMASEPLETMQDAIAMLKNPDTKFDFMQSVTVGAIQGFVSAFGSSTRNYTSIHDFVSDPANRTQVFEAMGFYPDEIEDPADRAMFLAAASEICDACIPTLEKMLTETDDGVGTIAKSFAGYQSKKLIWAYNTDVLNQLVEAIQNTPEDQRGQWFASETDYNRAQAWKSFKLNLDMVRSITQSPANMQKLQSVQQLVTAYCATANSLRKGASIQDFLDKMFPKVDKNGNKIQTSLYPTIDSDSHIAQSLQGNPIYDTTMISMKTGTTPITVGSMIGMDRNNERVYGRKGLLWIGTVNKYKAKVQMKDESTGKTYEVPMREYLRNQINALARSDQATADFLNQMFFNSGNIDNSYMFYEDGSLTALWEKMLDQAIPEVSNEWMKSAYKSAVQKIKDLHIIKSVKADIEAKDSFQDGEAKADDVAHNSNPNDNIPVSLDPKDYPDVEGLHDIVDIIEPLNKVKKHLPTINNQQGTVWIPLDKAQAEVLDSIIEDQANSRVFEEMDNAFKNGYTSYTITEDAGFPKVKINDKTYSLVMFNNRAITKQEFSNANHDIAFSSFYLVDFENETLTIDITNNIRPKPVPKKFAGQKRWQYYHNNRCCTVTTKDWTVVDDERVLNFTYWYNDKTKSHQWKLSSTLTAENLNQRQIRNKVKQHHIFLSQPRQGETIMKKLYIWNQQITFDGRNISTISDIVFNPDNKKILISTSRGKAINLDVSNKKFNDSRLSSLKNDNLLEYLESLWWRVQDADYYGQLAQNNNLTDEEKDAILEQAANETETMTDAEIADNIEQSKIKATLNYKKVVDKVKEDVWDDESLSGRALRFAFWDISDSEVERGYMQWKGDPVQTELALDITNFKNGKTVAQIAEENWIPIVIDQNVFNKLAGDKTIAFSIPYSSRLSVMVFKDMCPPPTAIHELYHAISVDSKQREDIIEDLKEIVVQYETEESHWRTPEDVAEEMLADLFKQYFVLWEFNTYEYKISDELHNKIKTHFDSILDWKAPKKDGETALYMLSIQAGIDEEDIQTYQYISTPENDKAVNEIYTGLSWNTNEGYEVQKNNFDAVSIWADWKIPAIRRSIDWDPNHSFWNPFDWWNRWEYWVREATVRFYKRLKGTDYQDVNPEQRQWIVDQIQNGSLQWKTVVYYTEDIPNKPWANDYWVDKYDDKHPNHAMVLKRFIDWVYTIEQTTAEPEKIIEDVNNKWEVNNKAFVEKVITDNNLKKTILDDCKQLELSLEILPPETLYQFLMCYKEGKGFEDAIQLFADQMPSMVAEKKFLQILVNNGIVKADGKYDGLSISQSLALLATKKFIDERTIRTMADAVNFIADLNPMGPDADTVRERLKDSLVQYYITTYLWRTYSSASEELRKRIWDVIDKKLLDENTFIMKPVRSDTKSDDQIFNDLLNVDNEVRAAFAQDAYNKKLISAHACNYLMKTNSLITVIWDRWWSVGQIGEQIINAINVPELKTAEVSPELKLQFVYDVYNFFKFNRAATYDSLNEYLRNKYETLGEEWKKLIDILFADNAKSHTQPHSDDTLVALKSISKEDHDGAWYKFAEQYKNDSQQIIQELKKLEQVDENRFLLLISFAPVDIKNELYSQFQSENQENKTKFIPIQIISGLFNNREAIQRFYYNSIMDDKSLEDVRMLNEFLEDTVFMNPEWTATYSSILWIPGLDKTKWTVLYYSWEQEESSVAQYSSYPIMKVESLDMQWDANILYKGSLPDNLPEDVKARCIRLPNNVFIKDGKLCVPDIGSKILETQNLMYDYLGLTGLNIKHYETKEFQLTDDIKQKVAALKNNDEIYWLIFKNYVQPNYKELKDISRDEFTKRLNSESFSKVSDDDIYNCVAGRTLDDMIISAIGVINVATDWAFDIDVNSQSTIKELDIDSAWSKFTNIYSKLSSNKDKQEFSRMFADYMMAINKRYEDDNEQREWFDQFRTNHRNTIMKLYDMVNWEELSLDDIDGLLFRDNVLKNEETIAEKQEVVEQNRLIWIYNSPEYVETEKALKEAQQRKEDVEKEIEKLKKKYKPELDEYDASLMRLNDYMETINPSSREYAQLEKRWDNINAEKEKFIRDNITSVVVGKYPLYQQLNEAERDIRYAEWKLRALTADEHLIWTAYIDDSKVQGDERWAIDVDMAKDSSVLLEWTEEWSVSKAFEDKTIKVLNWIKKNCVEWSCKTVWSTKRTYVRWKLVNEELLKLISWEDAITIDLQLEEVWRVKTSEEWFNKSNLTKFIHSLANLKKTNPVEFRNFVFTKMFPYMNYDSDQFSNDEDIVFLRDAATSIYENPYNFYSLYTQFVNNPNFTLDWLTWFQFAPNVKLSPSKIEWLKQSASQEFIDRSPYVKKTEQWLDNMELHTDEYRKEYTEYFPNKFTPSDEQMEKMNVLVEAFNKKDEWWQSIFLPGIAGWGKTTLVTAFLKRIEDKTWMVSEKRRIEKWKQTAIILNTDIAGNQIAQLKPESDWYIYMKVDSTKGADPLYIKFKPESVHYRFYNAKTKEDINTIDNLNLDQVVKDTGDAYSKEAVEAMLDMGQWAWERKDWYYTWYDNMTVYIENIQPVTDLTWHNPHAVKWAKYKDWAWKTRSKYKQPATFECNSGLVDITFASEKHSTVNALMDLFSGSFGNIPTATIDSFFVQPSERSLSDWWSYRRYNEIRPNKITKGQVIIIDETQNTDSEKMEKFVKVMWEDNTLIFLWDFHQMWDGKFMEDNVKLEDYISETHRATEDINLWNKINAFTFDSLVNAWAIGWYLTDSNDFVVWDWIENNKKVFDKPIKDTLYVCKTNKRRRKVNDMYLDYLWGINEIISKGKTLQVMVAEMNTDAKEDRASKGNMPDEWLNMKWFTKVNIPNSSIEVYSNWTQFFVPHSSGTDGNDWVIKAVKKYMEKTWQKWTIFVPAFCITTNKESGKTVNNIILDEEVTNSEYDFINKSNVKQFYDAATRWAKHVILPRNSSRLIGITRQQALDLMNGVPIKWNVTLTNIEKLAVEDTIVPRIYKSDKSELMMFNDLLKSLQQTVDSLTKISNKEKCKELVNELVGLMELVSTDNNRVYRRQLAETYKELLKTSKFKYTNKEGKTSTYNIMTNFMRYLKDKIKDNNELAKWYKKIETFENTLFWQDVLVPDVMNTRESYWETYNVPANMRDVNAQPLYSKRDAEWNPIVDTTVKNNTPYYEVEEREENGRIEYDIKMKEVDWNIQHRNWWIDYTTKEERQDKETAAVKDQTSRLMDKEDYTWVMKVLDDLQEELRTITYSDEAWTNVLINSNADISEQERQQLNNYWIEDRTNLWRQFNRVISKLASWTADKFEVLDLIDNAEAIIHQDLTAGIIEQEYDVNTGWIDEDFESNFTCW